MSQSRGNAFHPSSPRSSIGGAESFQATPETRLTAFSPDDVHSRSPKPLRDSTSADGVSQPIPFPVGTCRIDGSRQNGDPFVTSPSMSRAQWKLSPTASTFRPFSAAAGYHAGRGPEASEEVSNVTRQPISSALSSDVGISRYLALSVRAGEISSAEFESFMAVRSLSIYWGRTWSN